MIPLECAGRNVQERKERKDEAVGTEIVECVERREQMKEEPSARRCSQRAAAKDARSKTQLILDS